MITNTAHWRLTETPLTCGHTLAVRTGETFAWCSWCAATRPVLQHAAA
ncbi:hypothetical protein [Propioniciclava soli]|uniref:Uncharacterized protein n=1 Tax=Propioniciclava soli TaxID=2775081 RepID=A0ABZ3CBN9_9ACTN|nr:hypothetical protein [Propioniciclava soli]